MNQSHFYQLCRINSTYHSRQSYYTRRNAVAGLCDELFVEKQIKVHFEGSKNLGPEGLNEQIELENDGMAEKAVSEC